MSGELLVFIGTVALVFSTRTVAALGTLFYTVVASSCYAWAFHLAIS